MTLKKGDQGRAVKELQTLLDTHGFWTYHKITDYFGGVTETAVKNFQKAKGIDDDGVVGDTTYRYLLEGVDTDRNGLDGPGYTDTDNKVDMRGSYTTEDGLTIDRAYLDTDEYVKDYGLVEPVNLIIHHTAGWDNPYSVISSWNRDSRGRVATQYVIGGLNVKNKTRHDGTVVECFPDGYLGWHTGKVGNFTIVSKLAVGIELNNFGYLKKKGDKYYNYVDVEVPEDQVEDLGYEFRGYQYWHKYSEEQIKNLGLLIKHIKKIYPKINLQAGLPTILNTMEPGETFEFNDDAYYGKITGTWTHTNIRSDKYDCYQVQD